VNGTRLAVIFSMLLFGASMFTNVWPEELGLGVLLFGALEPVAYKDVGPLVAFAWYANPLLVAAWVCTFITLYRTAIFLGAAATLLSICCHSGSQVVIGSGGAQPMPPFEAGYWLWLASLGAGLTGAVLGQLEKRASLRWEQRE
jgi:hypothetical protein